MLSKNEWDQLKTVIVGIASDAKIPVLEKSLRTVNFADKKYVNEIKIGPYPRQVIDEANEDLEIFVNFLKGENVNVLRPDNSIIPDYYNYCPRDTVLIHDDKIIVTPNVLRARQNEYKAMLSNLKKYADPIVMRYNQPDDLYNLNCIKNSNILSLTEIEPAFDAANILRDNDNLYYLISNSGNKIGSIELQKLFPNKKVWTIENVYSYMHLDSTVALLREGLILLNPSRVKTLDMLPKPLRNWDVIWCPDPVDIGHYPGYCNASAWISMNLFSVNKNLVVLEKNQHSLRKELEKKNIDCAMLPMRHARTLGGCFHCVTLDIERNHNE